MRHAIVEVRQVPASGQGAIPGFEVECSCGDAIRSSLRTIAEQDAHEHIRFMDKKAAIVRRMRRKN